MKTSVARSFELNSIPAYFPLIETKAVNTAVSS